MRVLFLSNLYPPHVVGGYERLCHEVATAFAERGHEVHVLTSTYGCRAGEDPAGYPGQAVLREWELLTGVDIYSPFPGTPEDRAAANARNLATLARVLDRVRPDVVFAWNLFFLDGSVLDALETSPYRTTVMLTDNWLLVMRNPRFVADFFRDSVHGGMPLAPERSTPPRAWSPIPSPLRSVVGGVRRLLLGGPARKARRDAGPDAGHDAEHGTRCGAGRDAGLEAVFGSVFMREFYAAGGARFRRDAVVHNGVKALPRVPGSALPDRARLVRPGTLRLLFAGRLVDLKGAHTAVAAMPLLDAAALGVDRVELTVLGDAQDAAYMRRLHDAIAASGRAEGIALAPTVPEQELAALFDAHDIYLFPSLYEPFSLTLIHALACGIPTVASRVGGNPEIVRDGESGLLFEKEDAPDLAAAVARLARDPALRARLSRGGVQAGSAFTFGRMVDGMERFLDGGAAATASTAAAGPAQAGAARA